jgi:signal transduction histidine kinase
VIRTARDGNGRPATGWPLAVGRRIRDMSGELDPAGFGEYLAGRAKWIAFALFAAFTGVAAIRFTPAHPGAAITAAGIVVALGAAVLLVLGRRPQLLYAAVAAAGIAILAGGVSSNIGWFAVCLLAGWCTLTGSRREGLAFWAGTLILFAAEWLWVRSDPGWGAWLGGVTLTVAFGLLVRHEKDLVAQLREAQAGLAEQAKTQERNRIARELHDVIGHTLTVSLLHVQSARLAVEHDPSDASRALAEAERLGQECLAEVRMTVGILREDGGARSHAPLPGVDGLPALVERFQSAGADVTLAVEGDTARLPATTGLAVYRIVQEALTNAVKHAPGAPTVVRLAVGAGTVMLTADSRAEPGTGTGLGVVSMRERAESLGGSCEAGPGGQGWLVRATFPLDASLRAAP